MQEEKMLSHIIYFFFFLYPGIAYPSQGLTFSLCDDSSTYAANSTFSTNLAQALRTLRNTTAAAEGYAVAYAGRDEPVTAIALCRATLPPPNCTACINNASSEIRRQCQNQKSAQLWSFLCMIRYYDGTLIIRPNFSIAVRYADPDDAPDPDYYSPGVKYLMRNISSMAVTLRKVYGIGRMFYGHNQTMYGYVECTRDMPLSDCTLCLLSAREEIDLCCSGKRFGWITTAYCGIQFSSDQVFDDWANSPLVRETTFVAPPPLPVIPPPPPTVAVGRGGMMGPVIGVGVGGVVIVIVVVGVFWVAVLRRRRKRRGREIAEEMMKREGIGLRPFIYDFSVLVEATNNFSPSTQLGRGGFGTVYKGRMPGGEEIAVKMLAAGSVQGVGEFFNEVKVLLDMQHKNLVQLLGCCVEGDKRILVYEYLPNKSLDHTLFDKSKSALLDWPKRYNITIGVGRGLLYLHEDSLLKIIHRDIKASNILLDGQMNPKISDFGLAKLFTDEKSHLITSQIAGTFGYIAPEYANEGFLSTKSDVFSFGVLILEIISGRKNFDRRLDEEQQVLLNLAWRLEQQERLTELVDVTIGSFPQESVLRCMRIGLLCCQEKIEDRPTMSATLGMLSNDSLTIPVAGRPEHRGSNRVVDVEADSNDTASSNSDTGDH